MNAPATNLHPAHARQLTLTRWQDDPVVPTLLAALREIDALSARLSDLTTHRPDTGVRDVSWQLGCLDRRYVTSDRLFGPELARFVVRPNGGVCATIWSALDGVRDVWIEAQAVGLEGDAYYDRLADATHEADSVEAVVVSEPGSDALTNAVHATAGGL